MSRIDRLERDTRATLQLASVIGRSFYYRILRAISDSAIALDRHLSALALVELVREASQVPELQYMFKHELARDARLQLDLEQGQARLPSPRGRSDRGAVP